MFLDGRNNTFFQIKKLKNKKEKNSNHSENENKKKMTRELGKGKKKKNEKMIGENDEIIRCFCLIYREIYCQKRCNETNPFVCFFNNPELLGKKSGIFSIQFCLFVFEK